MTEIRTKIFSCEGISHNGRVFPKDVMEKAINDFNKNKQVGWITMENDENSIRLNDTVGTLKNVSIQENGDVFGDVLFIPTPEGKYVENLMTSDNPTVHLSPVGYGEVDKNGVVKNIDITHFNIRL